MPDYNTAAASGINSYIWSELQNKLGWSSIHNNVPIILAQQEPELANQKKPFIVYNWSFEGQSVMSEILCEKIAYVVYGHKISEVLQGFNLIVDLFRNFDWSAQDVNAFVSTNGTADQKKYDYKTINVDSANGPDAAKQEGGRHDALVVISCKYTVDLDDRGRRV